MIKVLLLFSSTICVAASQVEGCIEKDPPQYIVGNPIVDADTRNFDLIKQNMTPEMKVKKIKGCTEGDSIQNIQITLASSIIGDQLELETIGPIGKIL